IYALSANPQQAIIMAGHAGTAALWINDRDGQWSSTTYYREFPQIISQRNRQRPLRQRLDTMRWTPALKASLYPGLPMQKRDYPFRHTFTGADRDLFVKFKNSAPANTEVTDVAIDLLKNLSIGKRPDAIDMISVGYSAAPYRYVKDGDARMELADTYIRLDSQIGRLLDAIDMQTGLDNCVVFLTSTGYFDELSKDDPKLRIPSGEVSLKRVESLLNAYLSAKYGNGDYIDGIHKDHIYLNHKTIDSKSEGEHVIISDARDFIVKMSGIAGAQTLGDLLSDPSESGQRRRNALDPKQAGDIIVTYSPGWTVVDDTRYPVTETPQRSAAVAAPFILMAPGRKAEVINTPTDARRIAPTISSSIHIRAPNGAEKTSF
ncbi:MAG: alkaline phosphatase family protein, partial [Muribaculaceae bacterium]|nr:alkaline phosphatase family protein [Muribaculaceae bacterium]